MGFFLSIFRSKYGQNQNLAQVFNDHDNYQAKKSFLLRSIDGKDIERNLNHDVTLVGDE